MSEAVGSSTGDEPRDDRTDRPAFYRDDLQTFYDSMLIMGMPEQKALTKTKAKFKVKKIEVTPTGEVRSPGVVDRPISQKSTSPAAAPVPADPAAAAGVAPATGEVPADGSDDGSGGEAPTEGVVEGKVSGNVASLIKRHTDGYKTGVKDASPRISMRKGVLRVGLPVLDIPSKAKDMADGRKRLQALGKALVKGGHVEDFAIDDVKTGHLAGGNRTELMSVMRQYEDADDEAPRVVESRADLHEGFAGDQALAIDDVALHAIGRSAIAGLHESFDNVEPGSPLDALCQSLAVGPYKLESAVYRCPNCGKENGQVRTHHEDTAMEERRFHCPDCNHGTADLDSVHRISAAKVIDTRTGKEAEKYEGMLARMKARRGELDEARKVKADGTQKRPYSHNEATKHLRNVGDSVWADSVFGGAEHRTVESVRIYNRGKATEYRHVKLSIVSEEYDADEGEWKLGRQWNHDYCETSSGAYIGGKKTAHFLCTKKGIAPEVSDDSHNVCSIGFCEDDGKWYGWSHRAIVGFGKGDKIFDASWIPEDAGDETDDFGDNKAVSEMPFIERGGETIKTNDDAKAAARAFADYVS